MKVLIAGASGALGTPLTRALIAGGHEVLGLARSPESMDHLSHLGAHPILANVMDRDAMDTFMGQHLSSLSWRPCAAEAFLSLMGAARSPPGFIWKMRQPPRSQPSNGARQEKRITSSMTNRCAIKTSSRSSASRLTSRCPFHSQAG